MAQHYDYLVIGGGSGGIASARRAAEHGARVALVEAGRLGGTCVNVGCVPKKMMWNTARIAETLHDAGGYGFNIEFNGFDWSRLKMARDAYIDRLIAIYSHNLGRSGVTVINGWARFNPGREVAVANEIYTADHILIATGGMPTVPDIPGAQHGITSDDFFALEQQPQRIAIVGAGFIAVELAGVLNALGSDVTLILRKDHILRHFDDDLSKILTEEMQDRGIRIRTHTDISSLNRETKGVIITTQHDEQLTGFDQVLWAIGRQPNLGSLALDRSGVALDTQGFIKIDDGQASNLDGIYAVGDVTDRPQLTPLAIAAGRRLADRLFGNQPDAKQEYDLIPSVIFSHPPIGTVGLSHQQAIDRYGKEQITIYKNDFVNLYYGVLDRKPRTLVKLITLGPEERVIGCHIIGEAADEIIQGFAVALRMGATKADFDRTLAIHPTAAEELVTLR